MTKESDTGGRIVGGLFIPRFFEPKLRAAHKRLFAKRKVGGVTLSRLARIYLYDHLNSHPDSGVEPEYAETLVAALYACKQWIDSEERILERDIMLEYQMAGSDSNNRDDNIERILKFAQETYERLGQSFLLGYMIAHGSESAKVQFLVPIIPALRSREFFDLDHAAISADFEGAEREAETRDRIVANIHDRIKRFKKYLGQEQAIETARENFTSAHALMHS